MRSVEQERAALNWWWSLTDNQRYAYSIAYIRSDRLHEIYPKSFNSGFVYFIYDKISK